MKKIISLIIVASMLLSVIPVFAGSSDLKWSPYQGGDVRRTPINNYHSVQNPPDFKWQPARDAISYDLIVTKDKELKEIVYQQKNIKHFFYNFPHTFEPGIYYWSVKYYTKSGESQWAEPFRFLIDKDSYEFPVPDVSEIIKKIPATHPRILFNKEEQKKLRQEAKDKTNKSLLGEIGRGQYQATIDFPDEPKKYDKDLMEDAGRRIMYGSLSYALSGDLKVGEKAKENLMKFVSWDPNGISSFARDDQVGRFCMMTEAMGYDWLYEILNEDEKAQILSNVKTRVEQLFQGSAHGVGGIFEGDIYSSHGWTATGMLLETLTAVLHDMEGADKYIETLLPLYANLFVPWSSEDGGWSQGAYYWWSSPDNNEIATVLKNAGVLDLTKKAWKNNELFFDLYFWPRGALSLFGDDDNKSVSNNNLCNYAVDNPVFYPTPLAKWYRNQFSDLGEGIFYYTRYKDRIYGEDEIEEPIYLEKGKFMKDIGWIASHSDLIDKERISMYFKSSWYGANSHSHSDQNSFVIDAFGERLALDSGYYDSWGSTHDKGYSRQTHAHNTITHSDGVGQPTFTYTAKGHLTEFLTHPDFDLMGGDATGAYEGKIGKFKRNIIYLRPDQFIIIDDLKAKGEGKTTFEFWLNAGSTSNSQPETKLSVYDNKKGAKIEKGKAVLDASICYPNDITTNYSNIFSGADLSEVKPSSGKGSNKLPVHKRVWFQTKPVNKTKMVTAINVHKNNEQSKTVRQEEKDGVLKMSFTDGTDLFVNLTDKEEINVEGYTFKGLAFAIKGNTLMLVDGTSLKMGEREIFKSENKASVILGRGRLGISSMENDNKLKVNYKNLTEVKEIRDDKDRIIKENTDEKTGIIWNKIDEDNAMFNVYPGAYTLYLNGKARPGNIAEDKKVKLEIDINGNKTYKDLKSYYDEYDNLVTKDTFEIPEGIYTLKNITDNVIVKGINKGETKVLSSVIPIETKGNDIIKIELLAPSEIAKVTSEKDFEKVKNNASVFVEAEKPDIVKGTAHSYSTRKFLSGGEGLSDFNSKGDSVTYNVDVKEEGYYKFAIKYVSWNSAKRILKVGDKLLPFTCPSTGDGNYGQSYESWSSLIIDNPIYLKKGINEITLFADSGNWNMDFIAFIKE